MMILNGYQFWSANPARKRSPEVDYGVWWSLKVDSVGRPMPPYWRVSWLEDTHELYAVCLDGLDKYILISHIQTREEVEKVMQGWAEDGNDSMNLLAWIQRIRSTV